MCGKVRLSLLKSSEPLMFVGAVAETLPSSETGQYLTLAITHTCVHFRKIRSFRASCHSRQSLCRDFLLFEFEIFSLSRFLFFFFSFLTLTAYNQDNDDNALVAPLNAVIRVNATQNVSHRLTSTCA
jgi:hypothetical protein